LQARTLSQTSTAFESEQPIRCASISRQTESQKHTTGVIRCLLVAFALLAALLLIASAVDYTQGAATVKRVRLVSPHIARVPRVHLG
jgi:hypothetical protein